MRGRVSPHPSGLRPATFPGGEGCLRRGLGTPCPQKTQRAGLPGLGGERRTF
nr:MAG TPA: hypothetical protein [Caudoviricetes sp.]